MTVFDGAVALVLLVWFALTLIVQVPLPMCRRLRLYEPVEHWLPLWHFFAPKPPQADYDVYYRTSAGLEEPPGPWLCISASGSRRLRNAILNPHRLSKKPLFQYCHSIVMAKLQNLGPEELMLSVSYLSLLAKVTSLSGRASTVQFRIDLIRYDTSSSTSHTLFNSAVHQLAHASSDKLAI